VEVNSFQLATITVTSYFKGTAGQYIAVSEDSIEKLVIINPLKPELNPICYLLALLGAYHFLHVSRIRVKLLTLR